MTATKAAMTECIWFPKRKWQHF